MADAPHVDGKPIPRVQVAESPNAYLARTEERGHVAKPVFSIGIKDVAIPTTPHERLLRDTAMAILNEIVFGESGELYHRLFNEGLISPELSANYALARDFAFNQIAGEAQNPDLVLDRILAYVAELKKTGISRADFDRAVHVEYAEYIKSFDSTEEIATALLSCGIDGEELFATPDVIESLSFDEVTAAVEDFFAPDRITISIVMPQK